MPPARAPRRALWFLVFTALVAPIMAAISFGPPVFVTTGSGPSSVTVADFNGDGHADFATANAFATPGVDEITIAFGNGAGAFPTTSSFGAPRVPRNIVAADMDNDGDTDLVLTTNQQSDGTNAVHVLINNGAATFAPLGPGMKSCLAPPQETVCDVPSGLAVADLNEDGYNDIIVSQGNNISGLTIHLSDGFGGFGAAIHPTLPAGSNNAFDVVAADFNGDGHMDVALAASVTPPPPGPGQPSGVIWIYGDGTGAFGPAQVFYFPFTVLGQHGAFAITAADIDHDGDIDTATVAGNVPGGASIFRNSTSAGVVAWTWSQFTMGSDGNPVDVLLSDLDGDGHVDIASAGQFGLPPWGSNLAARPGNGDGTFGAAVAVSVGYTDGTTSHWNPKAIAALGSCGAPPVLLAANENKSFVSVLTPAGGGGGGGDALPPVITPPPDVNVTAGASCAAAVNPGVATATDNCGSATVAGVRSDGNPLGAPYPVGTTTITWTATDAASNTATAIQTVTVAPPPLALGGVSASPASIWPPNHKWVDVTISYSATGCGTVSCTIGSITSNEPVNGLGDGDTAPDWQIDDNHHVRLRAERAGGGAGRVYTIAISCSDSYGQTTTSSATVTVPHNK